MFCLEELRLLCEAGYCPERLSTVMETIELLHGDSQEEIPYYEQKIIDMVRDRLINVGLKNYGAIDPINDKRDFIKEAIEEVIDSIVYLTAKLIQLRELK